MNQQLSSNVKIAMCSFLLATSQVAIGAVSFDQSYAYAGSGISGTTVSSPTGPYTYTAAEINQSAVTSGASPFVLGTTDSASVQSFAGAAGDNRYGISDATNGFAATAGIVYKRVDYTATQNGTLTVNTRVDAGSTGTSGGVGEYSNGVSGTQLIWTASINGVYTHTLNVVTAVSGFNAAFAPAVLSFGGALNGATSVGSGGESSYSWGATSFTDTVSLVAGQTVALLYTLNEISAGYYIDDLSTTGVCGDDGKCGSTYVNFGGTPGSDLTRSSFDFSFEPNMVVSAVPEPGEWAMMIVGLGLVGAISRRKARKQNAV